MKTLSLTTVLVTLASRAIAQTCYSADGQELDARYKPCYPGSSSSGCCMLNGTQGTDQDNDLCLDSGLCQSTSGWYAGFLYINGCTDQSGNADGCPKLCNFLGQQYSWNVLQCEPGKFCCRAASDTENCCNNNQTIISTSHIGSLLLPGSTQLLNTTYNSTNVSPSTTNGTCTSNPSGASSSANSSLVNEAVCPVDNSAVVGGAVGGVLGAALIGALVALVFALRGRKQARNGLHETQATLIETENQAAEEKANHQKQLEEQQRHVQSMPPNYASGYHAQSTNYPTRPPPPNEMDSHGSHVSELGGGPYTGPDGGSRVELL